MKNKLADLNDHLFAQLERLSDESILGVNLEAEFSRARCISVIATQIINNGKLTLEVQRALDNEDVDCVPEYLGG